MAEAAEAEEIFTEVEEETAEVAETTADAMDVVTDDLTNMSDDVINVTEEIDTATSEIDASTVDELISSDSEILDEITTDVNSTTESVISETEAETGTVGDEAADGVGSKMSKGEALQKAGADAAKGATEKSGFWYRLKQVGGIAMKVVGAYIAIDFVGKQIVAIKDAIEDGTQNPPWKGSLTADQKKQLVNLSDAASKLKDIFESWDAALKKLEQNVYTPYGTMTTTVGGRTETVQVIDVCAYLVMDAIQQMEDANDVLKKGVDELTTFDLTQVTNNVFTTFSDAQAMIDLRDNKNGIVKNDMLATYLFPPKKDDATVKLTLITDFPNWQASVKSQGMSVAKLGATYAVGAFVKSQVILKIHEYLREHIYPQIRDAAKAAGTKAAKDYVNGEKSTIIEKALIPIVGPEKAREYGKTVREKAIEKAKAAASTAGKQKANELKSTIKEALTPIVQQVKDQYKLNMTQIANYAAKSILAAAYPPST